MTLARTLCFLVIGLAVCLGGASVYLGLSWILAHLARYLGDEGPHLPSCPVPKERR
jgi:hypothetical protein